MTKTALDLKPHERQAYKPDKMFKLRTIEDERKIKTRYQAGWVLARKAATLLKSEFGAEKVFVFGSLLPLLPLGHKHTFKPPVILRNKFRKTG